MSREWISQEQQILGDHIQTNDRLSNRIKAALARLSVPPGKEPAECIYGGK
jgi:hypothetical protein